MHETLLLHEAFSAQLTFCGEKKCPFTGIYQIMYHKRPVSSLFDNGKNTNEIVNKMLYEIHQTHTNPLHHVKSMYALFSWVEHKVGLERFCKILSYLADRNQMAKIRMLSSLICCKQKQTLTKDNHKKNQGHIYV